MSRCQIRCFQLIARFMALQIASAAFGQQGPSFGGFLQSVLGSAAGGAAGGFTGGGSPSASNLTSSKGNVFETRMIRRHALGGLPDVGSTPALFRMSNGQTGSAREGGIPEAIMPLQRMSNGELGVRAASNGGGAPSYAVHLTINSSSGDAAGSALAIKKLIPQIEASIVSALSRGTNRSLVSAVRVAASSS
jgi:phage-related minor tail protein